MNRPRNQYACTRCRRLKKKCSKEFPKCANCRKQNEVCEYVERKNKRKRPVISSMPASAAGSTTGSVAGGAATFAGTGAGAGVAAAAMTGNPAATIKFTGSIPRQPSQPITLAPIGRYAPAPASLWSAAAQDQMRGMCSAPGSIAGNGAPIVMTSVAGSVDGTPTGPPGPGSIAGSVASTTLLPPLGIYSMRQQQSALRGTRAPSLLGSAMAGSIKEGSIQSSMGGTLGGPVLPHPPVLPLPPTLSLMSSRLPPIGRAPTENQGSVTTPLTTTPLTTTPLTTASLPPNNNLSLTSSSVSSPSISAKERIVKPGTQTNGAQQSNAGQLHPLPLNPLSQNGAPPNGAPAPLAAAAAALTGERARVRVAGTRRFKKPRLPALGEFATPTSVQPGLQSALQSMPQAPGLTSASRAFDSYHPLTASPSPPGGVARTPSTPFFAVGSAACNTDSSYTEMTRCILSLGLDPQPASGAGGAHPAVREPTRTVVATAVDAYFAHSHRQMPFLNEHQVRRRAHLLGFHGSGPTGPALATAATAETLLVLALGCRALESGGTASKMQHYPAYFARRAYDEICRPGAILKGIQAVRILVLFCASLMYGAQVTRCWIAVGALCRMAVGLGLHRAPQPGEGALPGMTGIVQGSAKSPLSAASIRARILFSIYSLDRAVSATLGRPVALADDDIDVALPPRMRDESHADIEISRRMVEMYRVEGLLLQNIHAVRAAESFGTTGDRQAIYQALRNEIEVWHSRCRGYRAQIAVKSEENAAATATNPGRTSFQNPTTWFNAEYYHLLVMLYKPCRLCPHPTGDNLQLLARCALQSLSFLYNLYTSKWFPSSWVIFYRFLSINRVLLYCLCRKCIDLQQVKANLPLAREMLDYFATTWPYASQLSTVLAKVTCSLDDVTQLRQLAAKYQRVLTDNAVNLWPDDDVYMKT